MSEDGTISARDFGRLEGKVDGIAQAVADLKLDVTGAISGVKADASVLSLKVGKLEVETGRIDAAQKANRVALDEQLRNEGLSLTMKQTAIMIVALVVSVAVAAAGWLMAVH